MSRIKKGDSAEVLSLMTIFPQQSKALLESPFFIAISVSSINPKIIVNVYSGPIDFLISLKKILNTIKILFFYFFKKKIYKRKKML